MNRENSTLFSLTGMRGPWSINGSSAAGIMKDLVCKRAGTFLYRQRETQICFLLTSYWPSLASFLVIPATCNFSYPPHHPHTYIYTTSPLGFCNCLLCLEYFFHTPGHTLWTSQTPTQTPNFEFTIVLPGRCFWHGDCRNQGHLACWVTHS